MQQKLYTQSWIRKLLYYQYMDISWCKPSRFYTLIRLHASHSHIWLHQSFVESFCGFECFTHNKTLRAKLSHLTPFVNTTDNVKEKTSLTIQKTWMTLQGDNLCIYSPQLNITRALWDYIYKKTCIIN